MLRDRLVCGINNPTTQKKLLAEQDLTYERAKSIALGSESADQKLREMSTPANTSPGQFKKEPVNTVNQGNAGDKPFSCHRCGTPGQLATQCRFKRQYLSQVWQEGPLRKSVSEHA